MSFNNLFLTMNFLQFESGAMGELYMVVYLDLQF